MDQGHNSEIEVIMDLINAPKWYDLIMALVGYRYCTVTKSSVGGLRIEANFTTVDENCVICIKCAGDNMEEIVRCVLKSHKEILSDSK